MKQLLTLKEEDLIFFDIETAKLEQNIENNPNLHSAWVYKARNQNEVVRKTGEMMTAEEYYNEKAALYAPFGRVVTVVVGRIVDNKIILKSYASYDEKELLDAFSEDLDKVYSARPNTRLVGFNSIGFDTPFLVKRMIVNGIRPNDLLDEGGAKPWEVKSVDLAQIWKGNAFYMDSLSAVAATFGLPTPKDALDGSQVSDAFYENRLDEIVTYCQKDVETTIRLFRKMRMDTDLDSGFEIKKAVEIKNIPLLEKLYLQNYLSEEIKEELENILSKKKITKKDKENIQIILEGVYIRDTFMASDDNETVERKKNEISEFLKINIK